MKVPYRPSSFQRANYLIRYIIIHDVNCMFSDLNTYLIDSKKFQTNKLRTDNYILNTQTDLNYHFIVEKIEEDFETLLGRPLTVKCEYEDIKSQFLKAIHVGLMGSYTYEIPNERFYRQLAYRCLVPLMGIYGIPISNIVLHREVSNNKESECPGDFFKKNKLLAHLKSMLAIKG